MCLFGNVYLLKLYNQLKLGIQYFLSGLENTVQLLFKAVIKRTTGHGLF